MVKKALFLLYSIRKRLLLLTSTPYMRIILILPPLLSLVMVIIITWQLSSLPPMVPLYYSRPWGEEQLAQKQSLFIFPLGILFWYIVTIIFIHVQTHHYRVFAQLLLITQAILACSVFYILIRIILLMR